MGNKNSTEPVSAQTGTQGAADDNHPDNKKLSGEDWTDLKERKRPCCTDCLCLLLLIICWIIMTVIGFCSIGILQSDKIKVGNPNR